MFSSFEVSCHNSLLPPFFLVQKGYETFWFDLETCSLWFFGFKNRFCGVRNSKNDPLAHFRPPEQLKTAQNPHKTPKTTFAITKTSWIRPFPILLVPWALRAWYGLYFKVLNTSKNGFWAEKYPKNPKSPFLKKGFLGVLGYFSAQKSFLDVFRTLEYRPYQALRAHGTKSIGNSLIHEV